MENLSNIESLLIKQRADCLECIPCFDISNEYQLFNSNYDFTDEKENIGKIIEESDSVLRCICKSFRQFESTIVLNNKAIGRAEKPYKCPLPLGNCSCCCQPEINVYNGKKFIGSILSECFAPIIKCSFIKLRIIDADGKEIYSLDGNCLQGGVCCPFFGCCNGCFKTEIKIIGDDNNHHVGSINRLYPGCVPCTFTRADNFGITFPKNANVDHKLLIIHAAILIDFMSYSG